MIRLTRSARLRPTLIATAAMVLAVAPSAGAEAPSKTSFKTAKVTITRSEVPGLGMQDVLTDKAGYAMYFFSEDKPAKRRSSRCYGGCAKDWPPLLTKSKPKALGDARQGLLGITRRRDGSKQVTYRNRPVYYYVHEFDPGFVSCHDVFLNGGDWYAVKPNGRRLP